LKNKKCLTKILETSLLYKSTMLQRNCTFDVFIRIYWLETDFLIAVNCKTKGLVKIFRNMA